MATSIISSFNVISLSLTSIFTPPSSCRMHWTYEASFYNSVSGGLLLQNALAEPLDTACFPAGFGNSGRESLAPIYSPGYCPIGYSTPAQFLNGATTTAICCSTSFSYFSTLTTIDNFSPTSSFIFAGCISTYPTASGATTVLARAGDADLSSTVVSGPITMWGQPIQVAFQEKDLSLYTTKTSAPAPSTEAQPSSYPVTQATATVSLLSPSMSPPSVPSNSNGLSTGAKAGIGLGVAVVGAFLIVSALFLLWTRRKRARSEEQRMMGTLGESQVPTESQEKENPYRDKANDGSQPAELESPVQELDSSARVEMHDPRGGPVAEMESREHLASNPPPERN